MSKINLFFSAGEISGDMHGADLIRALKKANPDIQVAAMGGRLMAEAGAFLITKDASFYSAIGLSDSIKAAGKHLSFVKIVETYLKNNRPDAVVLIDHPGVNFMIAAIAKKLNVPVYYYFPPHAAVYSRGNAPRLAKLADKILCPNYEDYLVYKSYSENAVFCGNPLLDRVKDFKLPADFKKKYSIDLSKKIAGILPGSRFQELKALTPIFMETTKKLIEKDIQVLMPVSHPVFEEEIKKQAEEWGLTGKLIILPGNMSYAVMAASDVMIVKSGTAALESVMFHKPTIICYKISPVSFFIGKFLVKGGIIGLPNIIAGRKIFPELLQKECNADLIVEKTTAYLNMDSKTSLEMGEAMKLIESKLGTYPVLKNITGLVLNWLSDFKRKE